MIQVDGLALSETVKFLKDLEKWNVKLSKIKIQFRRRDGSGSFTRTFQSIEYIERDFPYLFSRDILCNTGPFTVIENFLIDNSKNLPFFNSFYYTNITDRRILNEAIRYDNYRNEFYQNEIIRWKKRFDSLLSDYTKIINRVIKLRTSCYVDPCYVDLNYVYNEDSSGTAIIIKPSSYYPVNKYGLLIYNKFGYVGNSTSIRNIQLRRTSDNDIKDFLFDKNNPASVAAVNLWRVGSPIRLVRRYNEGLGGAAYDLIQNTSSEQPFIDTTTWEVDYSGGNYRLGSLENTSITDKNSIAITSYQTQATIEPGVVFEEFRPIAAGNYNRFFSSTNGRVFYFYRPDGNAFTIQTPNNTPTLTYRVSSQRKVGDEVKAYLDNNLVGSVTSVTDFRGYLTSFREGFGISNSWFNGKTKGYIVHNTELTIPILEELSTHLGE